MGRPLKIQKQGYAGTPGLPVDAGFPQINTLTDPVTPPGLTGTNFYGVVGGNVQNSQNAGYPNAAYTMADGTATFPVIAVSANIYGSGQGSEAAFITRQKGQSKYLVTGAVSGATGVCFLANVANASLTANSMSIGVSVPDGTGNVGVAYLQRLTNKYGLTFPQGVAQANIQYFVNFFDPAGNISLANVNITGNAGTFTTTATTILPNAAVVISGTDTGTGNIVGYTDPTTYFVTATNGTTTFTLSTTLGGSNVVTNAGNTTGLTFTLESPAVSVAKSGADAVTFTNGTGQIVLAQVPSNP